MRATPYGPYALCGWRVFSELCLPELQPWSEALGDDRILTLELGGSVPADGEAGFAATADGGAMLRVPEVALFRINAAADRVAIHPAQGADLLVVRSFLYGSVLAVLCYKRGLFPLHGASILLGDSAVIVSGPIGAGKSTLAAALARRGHALLSDDVCAIDLKDAARPLLWPAFPRVKLLQDAIDNFNLGAAACYSRAATGTKGHFGVASFDAAKTARTAPVAAIYALAPPEGDAVSHKQLRGKDAFVFLESQAHRAWMGRGLGLGVQLFRCIGAVAAAVPVYRLERPRSLERLDETVRLLERAHCGEQEAATQDRDSAALSR